MAKITKEQIFEVADQMADAGQNPTLAAVRKALGGGSFTTISDAMTEWRSGRQAPTVPIKEPAPADIVDRVEMLASDIWVIALGMANDRLRSEREALEASRLEHERQQQEAAELADAMAAEIEQLRVRVEEQDSLLEEATGRIGYLEDLEQAYTVTKEKLNIRLSETEKRLDDHLLQLEVVKSELALERLNVSDGLEREKEQAVVIARLETEKAALERQLQALQKQLLQEMEDAKGIVIDLEQKLEAARESASSAQIEAGKMSGELQALRSQVTKQEELIKSFASSRTSRKPGGKIEPQ